MLKKLLILGVVGGLLALGGALNPSQLSLVNASQAAKLFVVSAQGTESTNEVYRYNVEPTGSPTLELTITDPSLDKPFGLAFNAIGEMFVVNRGPAFGTTGSVSRFLDPQGAPVPNGTITSSRFSFPHLAVFRNGELFIAQATGNNVVRFIFDAAGNAQFNGDLSAGLCCTAPRGVTVSPTGNELFVTQCCGVSQINRYLLDASGNATPNGVITGGGLNNPHDMAFSPWSELFVANSSGCHCISRFIFDAAGNASPNGQITGNGLNGPIGLDFSPWGELFVSNHFSPSVSRFTFDALFNAIPNGSFSTPASLGDLQFFPAAPTIPFATFAPTAKLDLGSAANDDKLNINGNFTLGTASNGINPLTEDVRLQVGTFSTTIPAGSFTLDSSGDFRFAGILAGVTLKVQITPIGGGAYTFKATGDGTDLTGTMIPVSVSLTIGDDSGSATLKTVKVMAAP